MDDGDPLNWPMYKKLFALALVSLHAMMFSFTAAAIQCAFVDIARDLAVSVQQANYLTTLCISLLGSAPLLWEPLAHTYGRRPVFLVSLAGTLVGNVGCAVSLSYAAMGVCRAVTAFFVSPAASLGSGVVCETFKAQRGRCLCAWAAMITLGVPLAPLVFGFVALRIGYRWIYWIIAIINSCQLLLQLALGSETRYLAGPAPVPCSSPLFCLLGVRRFDPTPLTCFAYVRPLTFVARPCIALPAASYAMVFPWGSIMTTLEIPQIFPVKFGLNAQDIGLQTIAVIAGTLIGEQFAGFASDMCMTLRARRLSPPPPEFRLWLSYAGYTLTIVGVAVFFLQLARASGQWNITPLLGVGVAAAGNQMVTTVLMTYAVDCYPDDASAVAVFINFVRQTWGFLGPFWFPQMIDGLGFKPSIAVPTSMIILVSVLPTVALQSKGRRWNQRSSCPAEETS